MTYVMTSYDMTHDITYDTPNARCEVERDTEQPLAVVHTVEILGQYHCDTVASQQSCTEHFDFPSELNLKFEQCRNYKPLRRRPAFIWVSAPHRDCVECTEGLLGLCLMSE